MKYVLYSSLIFLFISFVLGQLGRIDISPGLTISFLDISVFLVVATGCIHIEKIRIDAIFKILVVFFLICVLSLILRVSQLDSNQLLVSFLYLIRFFMYSLLYFVFRDYDRDLRKKIVMGMFVSGFFILVLGYFQYFFYNDLRNLYYLGWDEHIYRLFSTFLDPNFAGAFLVLYFLFVIGMVFNEAEKQKKILLSVLSIITLVAIFLTFSRSTLIMLIIGFSMFMKFLGKKKLILYLLFFLGGMTILVSSRFYIENMNLFRVASSEARLKSMQEAFVIFQKNPILGVGFNTYRFALISNGFRDPIAALVNHADASTDNSFLFVLATTGIVGFVAYVFFWYIVIRKVRNVGKIGGLRAVMIASIIGIFVDSLFINSLFYPSLMLWMWVLLAVTDYT